VLTNNWCGKGFTNNWHAHQLLVSTLS
jgi:hypothetical protein